MPISGDYSIEQRKPRRRAATPTMLERFERDAGLQIPRDYRCFLLCQNGGVPVKRRITWGRKAYQDTVLKKFFGVTGASNLAITLQIYDDRIPSGTFPIACDEFGNLLLIAKRSETLPVLFWDHEKELDRGKPSVVAPNLLKFLAMLETDKMVEYEIATIIYQDGERQRFAQPNTIRFMSIDRETLVGLRQLKTGECIDLFGTVRKIKKIEYTKESHPG
ncbi:SMI1/KNR4 family protein [Novipirellula sp.]|uniref:SMI1/KNR4 family protein n=1 Tax=Novipirellula sp. TaxID=2795430 RepID=UPI00356AA39A